MSARPLAVVTGASSGIGLEFARICAARGYDIVIAADAPAIHDVAAGLRAEGRKVEAVEADLATAEGVDRLMAAVGDGPVDVLVANAGEGLGGAFLDHDFAALRHVVDTNVTGTLHLLHRIAGGMRARRRGRLLVTGSIAGLMPGSFNAVYNASKAFVDNFSYALRDELRDSGVSVTCLMPGATDTAFFARAGMTDTRLGQAPKEDPAKVARTGWEAMMRGDAEVVSGWSNKVQAALARVTPGAMLARAHGRAARPGSGAK